jgi:large subunit ribosomal protein L7e
MGKRVVPENFVKKQKRDEKLKEDLKAAKDAARKERVEKRKLALANGEKYYKEYQDADRSVIENLRKAKKEGNFWVAPEAKVAFVIRTRGINKLDPKCKKILQLLRVRQIHNGVFVRLNRATINMIRRVEPYITYGYPNRKTIKHLIYKRGYGKVNKSRIPLSDNQIIEDNLGKHGIANIEDLIHEIVTCGPKFKEANNFLWPFKLNTPKRGYAKKRHPYQNGGVFGNREEQINELVRRML